MIDAIKFVRGAVAKKDFVPELTHFRIKDGRITGYNGVMALSSPINLDLDARPHAVTFANAVAKCEDTISIHMTAAGRLSVKSGPFRALVDCLDDDHTIIPTAPEGHSVDVGPNFMAALRAVSRYQGIDASRAWALGVLLKGASILATNNVMFVEYWHGHAMPLDMNLPSVAVKELLRINQDPMHVTTDGNTATFHFADDRWLRTALIAEPWPEMAFSLFDKQQYHYVDMPDIQSGLEAIKPFLEKDQHVYLNGDSIGTSTTQEVGTHYEVPGVPAGQCYAFKVLELLDTATAVDFTHYPAPCGFLSDGMRGIFLGLRM